MQEVENCIKKDNRTDFSHLTIVFLYTY